MMVEGDETARGRIEFILPATALLVGRWQGTYGKENEGRRSLACIQNFKASLLSSLPLTVFSKLRVCKRGLALAVLARSALACRFSSAVS